MNIELINRVYWDCSVLIIKLRYVRRVVGLFRRLSTKLYNNNNDDTLIISTYVQ